jgi:hypothetical protein
MQRKVTVRLAPSDEAALARLRGPLRPSTFLRSLLRQAAREHENDRPPTRVDALRFLAEASEGDRAVTAVRREIERRERLERLRRVAAMD